MTVPAALSDRDGWGRRPKPLLYLESRARLISMYTFREPYVVALSKGLSPCAV